MTPKSQGGHSIFYVYVLFDESGIPRYIGKGKGNRWLQHESRGDPNNHLKNKFIARTLSTIGEIPKIKIRQNITEKLAFEIERALITAIGRHPNGPLVNLTNNRNGPSSDRIAAWHASRTPEERSASAKKAKETMRRTMTKEQLSEIGRKNALAQGRSVLSERMARMQAGRTPAERRRVAAAAGVASAASITDERRQATVNRMNKFYAGTTRKQRQEQARKNGGISKASKEQLSKWGTKGCTVANSNRTPEQRTALARKAAAASHAAKRKIKLAQSTSIDPKIDQSQIQLHLDLRAHPEPS